MVRSWEVPCPTTEMSAQDSGFSSVRLKVLDFVCFAVVGIKPRTLSMLCKHSAHSPKIVVLKSLECALG